MTGGAFRFIEINDKLRALGVIKFVKQSNVIDIGFKGGQTVVFDIDPKKITNTRDNFEKEAKRYSNLSKSTISKVSLVLMDPTNNYLQYLFFSKVADSPNGRGDREHPQITTLSRNPAAAVTMRLAKKYCQDFFIDNLGQPHAAVKIDKHLEVLQIKSSRFKNWLCKTFYDFSAERGKQVHNKDDQSKKIHSVEDVENETEREEDGGGEEDEDTADILTTENLNNVLRVLEAKATFSENSPKELHLRVARYDNGNSILYDMTNPEWQVVRIAVTGWDIEYAPVVFTRYSNQIPQVYPSKEYPPEIFDRFMDLLNIKDSEDNKLFSKSTL